MNNHYQTLIFSDVADFLETIPESDKAKILAHITTLGSGDFETVFVKTIKSPLRELKVKRYRILFFVHTDKLYIVRIFIKKTQKTSLKEITHAQSIIKSILNKK